MRARTVLAAAAVCVCVIAAAMSVKNIKTAPDTVTAATAAPTELPTEPPVRTLTITATGDCTLAADVNFYAPTAFDAYAEKYGAEYFLQNVRGIFGEDDLTIVNFEGTLSDRGERENKTFAFRGDPSYVNILTSSSVEAANLANNHSSDYGAVSLEDTKMYLDNAGILNCRGRDNVCVTDINGIKVGLVGINYLNDIMRGELEDAITAAKTMPTADQTEAAHRAIDMGADLVIGTHPHVLEGIEKYNGRYILYSLGNFCFGGNSAPSDMDTAIWRQTFTMRGGELEDDDNCTVIPCRISGAAGYNDYCPTVAEGADADRIMTRLRSYSAPFGGDLLPCLDGQID